MDEDGADGEELDEYGADGAEMPPMLSSNDASEVSQAMTRELRHTDLTILANQGDFLYRLAMLLAIGGRLQARLMRYIREHPYLFTARVLGGVTLLTAICFVPVIGVLGFSPLGPVAGSIAAGLHAEIGAVAAGSLFAFCQSAAMGGGALGIISGVGVAGGVLAVIPGLAVATHHAVAVVADEAVKKVVEVAHDIGPTVAHVAGEIGGKVVEVGGHIVERLASLRFW